MEVGGEEDAMGGDDEEWKAAQEVPTPTNTRHTTTFMHEPHQMQLCVVSRRSSSEASVDCITVLEGLSLAHFGPTLHTNAVEVFCHSSYH
jgi:hypothetical protein